MRIYLLLLCTPCGADARGSAVIYARSVPRGIVPVAGCCHAGVQSILRQGFFLPDEKYDPVFHGDPVDRIAVCCQLPFAAPHIVDVDIGWVADTLACKSDCPGFDYCTTASFIDLISLRFSPPRMDNVLIKVDSSKLSKGGDAWQTTAPQGL